MLLYPDSPAAAAAEKVICKSHGGFAIFGLIVKQQANWLSCVCSCSAICEAVCVRQQSFIRDDSCERLVRKNVIRTSRAKDLVRTGRYIFHSSCHCSYRGANETWS